MTDTPNFAKLVPGFDFLQDLVKNAGAALPGIGQWVAPTLNPEELQKRIDELKTVQFWLEQNAKMLGTTIQALEVQRMTLSTLKTMNVQMADLRESMKIPPVAGLAAGFGSGGGIATPAARGEAAGSAPAASSPPAHPATRATPAAAPEAAVADAGASAGATPPDAGAAADRAAAPGAGVVDPMQWWNALTTQFTQLAANAMRESAVAAQTVGKAASNTSTQARSRAAGAADAQTGRARSTPKPAVKAASTNAAGRAPAKKRTAAAAAKTRAR